MSRRFPRRRTPRHDVVFYTPWIGSILSSRNSLPPGGAETQIFLLARTLARLGVRVAIVVFGSAPELPRQIDGVTIVARVPYRKRRRVIEKIAETIRIWNALWRARARTVVYRCAGVELGVIAIFTRLTGQRLVYSSANVSDFDAHVIIEKRRDQRVFELGVRLADAVVVQTEEQVGLCRAKFGRTPTMIKSLAPLAEIQEGTPEAFLWVGRLVSYKRPLEYLALAEAIPEARFWMVGVPMPHREDDRMVAEAVTLAAQRLPNLELLPPRPHDEIERLMARAVASVNTADFEGMPNVLLEAWTRGVPALVLSHDAGGVVQDYGLGGFADGSHERFVALARELWQTRADRFEASQRCRAYIAEHHAPDAVARRWLDVLSITTSASTVETLAADAQQTCAA